MELKTKLIKKCTNKSSLELKIVAIIHIAMVNAIIVVEYRGLQSL